MLTPTLARMPIAALLTVVWSTAAATQVRSAAPDSLRGDSVQALLLREMQKRRIPGLQVAVVQHGRLVLLRSLGLATVEDSVPVADRTVFPVHSITKAFTGVAVMQLVESGQLDLAAPVSRYVDSLPATWRAVTIRHLLTHMSGLPDVWDANSRLIANDEDAAWARVQTLPIAFAPGERFSYNQTNYVLLGRIIHKLTGEPYTRFIQKRQFDVVGMPWAGFGDAHDVVPHISGSYWYFRNVGMTMRRSDTLGVYVRDWPPFLRPATGLNISAAELAQWLIALQEGRLITKASLTTLWTPGVLNNGSQQGFGNLLNGYALGWPTASRPEHRAIGPTGGARAALFVYPEDDLAVVMLTNVIGASPESFIDEVAGSFVPDMRASAGFGLPPAVGALRRELMRTGFDRAAAAVTKLTQQDSAFHLREAELNAWGYQLVEQGRAMEAIEIFKLNARLYPKSWNTYDSLAEAYEAVGSRALAVENYRRSIALNARNEHAMERLKALSADPPNQ